MKVLSGNAYPVNVTNKIITEHTFWKGEKDATKVRLTKLLYTGKFLEQLQHKLKHLHEIRVGLSPSKKMCFICNTNTIHILPNFWRTKGNQPMKFGQLI